MNYGDGPANKFQCARRIVAALAYLLSKQSDGVGVVFLKEGLAGELPPRAGRSQFNAIVASLVGAIPEGASDLLACLQELAARGGSRGLRVLISDFYAEPGRIATAVAALRRRGHDVLALHVVHRDELEFPFEKFSRFEGLEEAIRLTCEPTALRDEYRRIVDDHCLELQRRLTGLGVSYRRIPTDQPLGETLAALLLERARA